MPAELDSREGLRACVDGDVTEADDLLRSSSSVALSTLTRLSFSPDTDVVILSS